MTNHHDLRPVSLLQPLPVMTELLTGLSVIHQDLFSAEMAAEPVCRLAGPGACERDVPQTTVTSCQRRAGAAAGGGGRRGRLSLSVTVAAGGAGRCHRRSPVTERRADVSSVNGDSSVISPGSVAASLPEQDGLSGGHDILRYCCQLRCY